MAIMSKEEKDMETVLWKTDKLIAQRGRSTLFQAFNGSALCAATVECSGERRGTVERHYGYSASGEYR